MIRIMGSRILCKDLVTTLSAEKRAEKIGIVAVISETEKPKSTSAIVVGVGTDPLLRENISVGDLVSFSYLSGNRLYIKDDEFRSLEFNEIITVDDGEGNEEARTAVLRMYNLTDGRSNRTRTVRAGEDSTREPAAEATPRQPSHRGV